MKRKRRVMAARRSPYVAAFVGLVTMLAACAGPPQTFDLATRNDAPVLARQHAILVSEPVANSPLNGDRLVVRRGDGTIAYLAGAQWADRLPRLVQGEVVAGIDGAYREKLSNPTRDEAYRLLTVDIQRFEADVTRKVAIVELLVRLSNTNGHLHASRRFIAEAHFATDNPALVADAFKTALAQVLVGVNGWVGARS